MLVTVLKNVTERTPILTILNFKLSETNFIPQRFFLLSYQAVGKSTVFRAFEWQQKILLLEQFYK